MGTPTLLRDVSSVKIRNMHNFAICQPIITTTLVKYVGFSVKPKTQWLLNVSCIIFSFLSDSCLRLTDQWTENWCVASQVWIFSQSSLGVWKSCTEWPIIFSDDISQTMKFRCSKVSSSCFGPICTFYLIVMKTGIWQSKFILGVSVLLKFYDLVNLCTKVVIKQYVVYFTVPHLLFHLQKIGQLLWFWGKVA